MSGVTLAVGEVVGGYVIEQLIGESGLDRVYIGADADGRRVTIKIPRFEPSVNAEYLRRFQRQAETAAKVLDPHLAAMLGNGITPAGLPFVVEEYVEGGSLASLLTHGRLELGVAVHVCSDVAMGLDALHAARIVHRNLTPAVILLDRFQNAKVTGFGLVKDRDATQLTRAGHVVGAASYIAPEQIRGEEVSAATDVYALGCVVYETLTGSPPYADQKGMKGLWAHLQLPPPDPRQQCPDLPSDISWAVTHALAKLPADRPSSATTFARIMQIAWESSPRRGGSAW